MNSGYNVQEILVDMIKWFHRICQENNLRYYCIGGTMLGIVRHKGFIPWDDDIDIGMPREDYEKLCSLASGLSNGRYLIEFPEYGNLDFSYLSMKIYDTSTTLVECSRKNIKRGVFIDVFPLDGIGTDENSARRNYSPIHRLRRFYSATTCAISEKMEWYKKIIILLGRLLSPLFISERSINNHINRMCKKLPFDQYEYVGNLLGAWGYKELMLRKYFGNPKIYTFENTEVYGVEMYHEYLSKLYGNYMQLPPVEKQVSHHDYVECNLNKSFLE